MALNIESCSIEEACASLGASEKLLIELRDRLQDWLKLQPHLPQDIPKEILEYFIIGTKMSLEQSKQKLDTFYTIKRFVPGLFADRDPRGSKITNLQTLCELVYLPKLTPEKYRVSIFRTIGNDSSKFDAYDYFRYALMMDEILMTDFRSFGSVYIFDHAKLPLDFIIKFTPTIIKKCEVTITEAYAKRIKAIHIINAAPITESVLSMCKKVLKPKLASRIHTHSRGVYESLYRSIPKSILPKDYGGEELPMAHLAELWRQKVDEKRDWFLEQEKIVIDERLRPGPAFDADNLFGFSGSFRKLDVD